MYLEFEHRLKEIMDPELDNLRIYTINEGDKDKIKKFGIDKVIDLDEPMII